MDLRKRARIRESQQGARSETVFGAAGCDALRQGRADAASLLRGSAVASGSRPTPCWPWRRCVSVATGLSLAGLLAVTHACCVNTLHENLLWFDHLTDVEREISFRTECGLYYSYYKQMLQAPSILEGVSELIYDNLTESKRTINLLHRMNIYQELFLSVLYRLLPIQSYLEPVYFYIYTVFSLQAVYVMALYLTAWLLAGSWHAGALTGIWYILNRVDTTRVEFTISLRENWSLPFLALQVAAITCYLRPGLSAVQQKVMVWLMYVSTFCFSLTWQFNQFILLVQALIVYTLDCVDLLTTTQVSSLLSVWLLQFFNTMILGSLVLSFIVAALLVRHFQRTLKTGSLLVRVAKLIIHSTSVLLLTISFNVLTKKVLQLRSDEHIFKFIKSKFAWGRTRDFDANLYLCEEAFGPLPLDTLKRFGGTLLLYPYTLTMLILLGTLAATALRNLRPSPSRPQGGAAERTAAAEGQTVAFRPDVAYNVLHTLFYGLLAFSTMRMKYIWTGHMCAVAAYGVCGTEAWSLLLHAIRCNGKVVVRLVRYGVPLTIMAFLYYKFWPKMLEELSDLREFYDPDTVELMTWIRTNTRERAVLAGSMQLLAAIKLCTGRIITNHPHYEDKHLRDRTRQVYQVYARRSPEDVYAILKAVGAEYVVLENSICYERRHQRGCRLRDLLDLANGHIMDGPGDNEADLVAASHPRFCDAIKTDSPAYGALFKRTFQNKTFHVYRLRKKVKKPS
ncbi:probable C-mannosyltransferase DPY19L3 isoform X2 [Dunckerocampus dactyliophorus]|uniref:probable C-mannosyltransferase DPY19L3 isoform X2 n=1 Tax=Dunckerocampus dactyliophorus TaxID=161453 RepID=UPI0024062145|nr:probable C-mannosyltransferase DPY19L3 isoform X2 [Dunckerocampus dactyliophorus]